MKTIVLNGAGAGAQPTNLVALLDGTQVIAQTVLTGRGASEHFAPTLHTLLAEVERTGEAFRPDRVVAVIGPGSFTGLRASLALASGFAAGFGCPTIGVTLGAALRATLARDDVTCVSVARRGRFFVDPPEGAVFAVPEAEFDTAFLACVTGDAVDGERVWGCPTVALLSPTALGVVTAAEKCGVETLSPLYVDPPEAKPPAAGLRPAPV
ncbi:tRNA (adenosine(37)-N6)-threonylcarbamoyltransferase complex dimerization subunit type 1 TsaB [Neokomagataea anthophila]|uniref:tRNA (adenosine(37)-N6)-threonylcarbamoyltransferase complex dimerization subunit type 1 TsaB n=1 Tax=Neokomagataea anthophila TaxID=2826925 RepID=UPI002013118B|nr:tRNA (adenosine(37)-N6)-threonylcarbamoyltransferase complex dimerization subunit type 1 TsaB [Neokomagataea anthophila]